MPRNVLVLGAVSSVSYGFPLARGLVDIVIDWHSRRDRFGKCGIELHDVEVFADQLARSGCTSIDQYVMAIKNDGLRKVGKELIAILLAENEVEVPRRAPDRWYERAA